MINGNNIDTPKTEKISKFDIGIYKIVNIINNKLYIGSTSKIGFIKRWNKHKNDLFHRCHHSIKLQRAWNKYGESNFRFEVIERCNPNECLAKEQYYIDKLKPEYNICKVAGNTFGYRYSNFYKNRLKHQRRGKNNPFYGKHHSEETKHRLSDIFRGKNQWKGENNPKYHHGEDISGKDNPFYGKHHSEETKRLISEINKGKRCSVNHPNFGGLYKFYNKEYGYYVGGQCDICKKYNLNKSKISAICNKKQKQHKGWIFICKVL